MDGRVYDATIGRFLSADIHVPHPYSTQSYNRYSYVRNNPLGFTDPSGYTDEENAPTNTSPDNKRSQRDATPNGSVSFTDAGMYVKGPLEKIYFPNSPIANMTIANPINFVNSFTNTGLNGLNALGTLLEPYDGIGYTMMMGGGIPPQRVVGGSIFATAKFGRVLRYVGTMGQSERKLFDQLSNIFGKNGTTTLYRAVSKGELNDIPKNGLRIKPGGYESKLFATSEKDAVKYGKDNFKLDGKPNHIIEVKIPSSVMSKTSKRTLDWKDAIEVPSSELKNINKVRELNYNLLVD